LDTVSRQIFGDIQETQFSGSKMQAHVHLKNAFPGGIGNRRIRLQSLVCLPPLPPRIEPRFFLFMSLRSSAVSTSYDLNNTIFLREREKESKRKREREGEGEICKYTYTYIDTYIYIYMYIYVWTYIVTCYKYALVKAVV